MTLKFFKLLQWNIEDDLNIIIPSNTDFLDELVEDCLPLLKGCVLIGACPSEQIAAIIFSFLVFPLNLLQFVLCSGQGLLCSLDRSLIFIQKLLDHNLLDMKSLGLFWPRLDGCGAECNLFASGI